MGIQVLDNVAITMHCHNTPNAPDNTLTVPFEYHQTTPDGNGQASSHKVQFNINKNAAPGTIFVDKNNDGICIATITSNHIATGAEVVFVPEGSFTEGFGKKPNEINESVDTFWELTSNKEVTFTIRSAGTDMGNVTLRFFVYYSSTI